MPRSMTGFAAASGELDGWRWLAEIRGVNGRGLDLRLRIPDWLGAMEPELRGRIASVIRRGNVTLSLRVRKIRSGGGLVLDSERLEATLAALADVSRRAEAAGLSLRRASAAEVLAQRGVVIESEPEADGGSEAAVAALREALAAPLDALIADFAAARAEEGARLAEVLAAAVEEIATLVARARRIAAARRDDMAATFRAALARLMEEGADMDEGRLAQELAVLAVKADVAEELDRLDSHVAAARDLLARDEAIGRQLDFLMQEFNREANTLCAKSQHAALTETGLELKVAIDRMREQVQNVE